MLRPLFSCYFVARYGKVCKTNFSCCSYKRESFAFTQHINLYVFIATFFQLPWLSHSVPATSLALSPQQDYKESSSSVERIRDDAECS